MHRIPNHKIPNLKNFPIKILYLSGNILYIAYNVFTILSIVYYYEFFMIRNFVIRNFVIRNFVPAPEGRLLNKCM
jgi:hypothetical protein